MSRISRKTAKKGDSTLARLRYPAAVVGRKENAAVKLVFVFFKQYWLRVGRVARGGVRPFRHNFKVGQIGEGKREEKDKEEGR